MNRPDLLAAIQKILRLKKMIFPAKHGLQHVKISSSIAVKARIWLIAKKQSKNSVSTHS